MKSWTCIEKCGACCKIDLKYRECLTNILSKEDIKYTLENNLKLFENAEEYEQCAKIFKALKTMSN